MIKRSAAQRRNRHPYKEEREMAAIDLYKRKVLTLKDAESLYEDTLEAMGLDESETELDIYEQIKDRLDSRLFCDFPAR